MTRARTNGRWVFGPTKALVFVPSGHLPSSGQAPGRAIVALRTLGYFPSRWPTWRRFDPSSSPSAINLDRQPLSSVDHPQNLQQTENTVVSPKSKLTKPIKKPKAVWVEPSFTAEVEYRDITSEGLLRQSSFKGLSKGTGRS
jgi:hypothetical protein